MLERMIGCRTVEFLLGAVKQATVGCQPDFSMIRNDGSRITGIEFREQRRYILNHQLIVLDREFTHHSIIAHHHRAIAIYITKTEIRSIVRVADGQDTIHLPLLIEGETGKEICSDHPYISLGIAIHSGAKVLECLAELSFYLFILTRWNDGLHRFEIEHLRTFLESYPKALEMIFIHIATAIASQTDTG